MVVFQIFGNVERSEIENGDQEITFRLASVSRRLARTRARNNARVKGVGSPEVIGMEEVGPGSIPGRTVFLVTVRGER